LAETIVVESVFTFVFVGGQEARKEGAWEKDADEEETVNSKKEEKKSISLSESLHLKTQFTTAKFHSASSSRKGPRKAVWDWETYHDKLQVGVIAQVRLGSNYLLTQAPWGGS
jgi:hypothetical protein